MQRSAPEHTATMAVMDSRQATAPLRLRAGVSVLSSPWHGFGKGGPGDQAPAGAGQPTATAQGTGKQPSEPRQMGQSQAQSKATTICK